MLRGIGYVVGWGSMMLAAAVLIVSRRNTYGLHILRGTVGVGVLTLSLLMLVRSLHGDWNAYAVPGTDLVAIPSAGVVLRPGERPVRIDVEAEDSPVEVRMRPHGRHNPDAEALWPGAFEQYLATARPQALPMSAGLALLALVLMCWPARRANEMTADPARSLRRHRPSSPPLPCTRGRSE